MADTSTVTTSQPPSASKSHGSYANRTFSYGRPAARGVYGHQYSMPSNANNAMAYLTQGMQAFSMQDSPYHTQGRASSVSGSSAHYPHFSLGGNLQPALWNQNNHMMLAAQQQYNGNASSHTSSMYNPQYMAQGYGATHENSPISSGWTPTHASNDLPTLITPRRESISSAENDTPGTPIYPTYHAMTHGGVTILNRSPSGTYTTSTPSPLQMLAQYGLAMPKVPEIEAISPSLKMLVTTEPAIPRAIPAPSSPPKPLDRSLENPRGETNVYIRGLMPETSDEMLDTWGRRFGDIKSSKSIIDHSTGLCKG